MEHDILYNGVILSSSGVEWSYSMIPKSGIIKLWSTQALMGFPTLSRPRKYSFSRIDYLFNKEPEKWRHIRDVVAFYIRPGLKLVVDTN